MRRPAFTLLELLVVVAIIGILVTAGTFAWQRLLEGGRSTTCIAHLHALGTGLNGYLGEHDLTMPTLQLGRESIEQPADVIDTVLLPYVSNDRGVFACPSDTQKQLARRTGTSYAWNVTLNGQKLDQLNMLMMSDDRSVIPVIGDKEGFHPYIPEKVNVLYADGHVDRKLRFK